MLMTLLEAEHVLYWNVHPMVVGAVVLGILLFLLIWVIGMGSGRPNSK